MTGAPQPTQQRWPWWVQWLLAYAVAGALAGVCGLAVVELGVYDVRAIRPHNAAFAWATHTTMIHSVRLRAGGSTTLHVTPQQAKAGFALYDANCALCHGGPAISRAAWVSGMTPTPPYLVDAADRWTPAQLHFIIAGGVKMTGMPAWGTTLSDGQISDLVNFLEVMPYTTGSDYQRLRAANAKH